MNTTWTIFRREMGAFFDSPVAYVVAVAFLLLNSALYVLDLWVANEASLRGFFEWVSWSACFIIPAITMRSWAEEKKGSTFELLLTLPSGTLPIVAGKFLAALAFYASCLAFSLVLPACLHVLAAEGLGPDVGAMAAGYLGTIAAGALIIALGMFVSGLCRDQIEAYIITLLAVLALRLTGFAPIASQIDAVVAGAGSFLRDSISFSSPHGRFVRGLVGLGDVLFLLAWTAGLLALNALFVEESRRRPGSSQRRAGAALLGLPVIALAGSLALELSPRADLTADRLHTVSDAAVEILQDVPESDPVRVKLYFSPKNEMPAFMASVERDVVERLEALQRRSKGRLVVEVVYLHADEAILRAQEMLREQITGEKGAQEGKNQIAEQLMQEGVIPFRVRSGGLTGTETKVVYAALTLTQGAHPKEVIPELMPGQVAMLEQELLTRIFRLVRDEKPVVGLIAPISSVDIDPQQLQFLAQLGMPMDQIAREQDDYRAIPAIIGQGQQYDFRRLRPDAATPLPDDLRTLIVVQPGALSARMAWEIQRFVHRGGSLILAVQAYDFGLRPMRQGVAVELQPRDTGVADLLSAWGLSVPQQMVLSEKSFPLTYDLGPFQAPLTVDFRWSFQLDAANFNRELSFANGLGGFVLIQAASPVRSDAARLAELGLELTPVLSTGAAAWTRDVPVTAIPEDINEPQPATGPIPLSALVRGQFPAPAATPPAWPGAIAEDSPDAPAAVEPKPGSVLVIGTAKPFRDDQIAQGGGVAWSGALLKNAVDGLSLGDTLLRLSVREPRPRPLRDMEHASIVFYEIVMIGLAPALVAALGVLRMLARRRRQRQPFMPARGEAAAHPAGESA